MSAVRQFGEAVFISAENSDIYFEIKAVLCFNFMLLSMFYEETVMFGKIVLSATVLSLRDLFRGIKIPCRTRLYSALLIMGAASSRLYETTIQKLSQFATLFHRQLFRHLQICWRDSIF